MLFNPPGVKVAPPSWTALTARKPVSVKLPAPSKVTVEKSEMMMLSPVNVAPARPAAVGLSVNGGSAATALQNWFAKQAS